MKYEWDRFSKRVLSDISDAQKAELEKAYYAGALTIVGLLDSISNDYSVEKGAEIFDDIRKECFSFFDLNELAE